ncbi:hypothetical protein M2282_002249 [Variovorax boronicumulans]|uniref:hypothetical protein n=1 Tax=Variovorax boronicumulans TaxID=436515 RepID=UPI002475BD15|nr:hypothetical protein [Variovorax boronicumulans]MDH6167100.1 hypothetical protein [Variovorax boronicumulans]
MSTPFFERWFANHFINRIGHKSAFALAMLLCMLWSTAAALRAPDAPAETAMSHEWPSQWDGVPLRPLALSEVEQRFADRFPGAIGRMTDGTQTLVMREVKQPTRLLHPAADCYRALGYRIEQARLERDAQARLWRCFVAQRHGAQKIRVCERIVDAQGTAFTDTSAWYWSAASGQSTGPWQAVTVARPM